MTDPWTDGWEEGEEVACKDGEDGDVMEEKFMGLNNLLLFIHVILWLNIFLPLQWFPSSF